MRYRTRTYYTDVQKALMWERWKEGWAIGMRIGGAAEFAGVDAPPNFQRSAALQLIDRSLLSVVASAALLIRHSHCAA